MVCELENWIYIKWFLGGRQETEPYKYWVTLSCVLPYDLSTNGDFKNASYTGKIIPIRW